MKKVVISLAIFCAMFFFVSCGESGSENKGDEKNDSEEVSDSDENDAEVEDSEIADEDATDSESDEPEELAYPQVTASSTKAGDIAQNITIFDDLDVEHKLAEWYRPNNPSSKLIWLIFTTYDCPPCHMLKDDLLEIYKPEYEERGLRILLVFNGLLSGAQPDLEPEKLAQYKDLLMSEYPENANYELYGYLQKEEQKVLRKFMGMNGGYPTLLFIDASTMEILDYISGWGEGMVGPTRVEIETFLDEL